MHVLKYFRRPACWALLALPLTLAGAPWKFAVMGDGRTGGENGNTSGVNEPTVHAIAEDARRNGVKLILFPGDLVNGSSKYGTLAQQFAVWKRAMAPLIDAKIPLYVVRGNHDVAAAQDNPPGTNLAMWREAFSNLPQNGPADQKGLSYSVEFDNACFIAADEFVGKKPGFDAKLYDSNVNAGMVHPWVIEQIHATKAPWVFVFGHTAAFIGHHKDCLANVPEERDDLWDALGARGGVYFGGHDHMYVRQVAPDRKGRPVLTAVIGDAGASPQYYDNSGLNAEIGRKVVPKTYFLNAKPDTGERTATEKAEEAKAKGAASFGPKVENTNGLPMYFGYLLITVDGPKISGEWRAFVNYDAKTMTPPPAGEAPKFEVLDRFTWTAK
jgi:hypothetical protein